MAESRGRPGSAAQRPTGGDKLACKRLEGPRGNQPVRARVLQEAPQYCLGRTRIEGDLRVAALEYANECND